MQEFKASAAAGCPIFAGIVLIFTSHSQHGKSVAKPWVAAVPHIGGQGIEPSSWTG
jgi:hypothetical protein